MNNLKKFIEIGKKAKLASEELLKDLPTYYYPFGKKVKNDLKKQNRDSIIILSYGSLINFESALRTLSSESLKFRKPFIGFGLRRIFNRDVNITNSKRYKTPTDPLERGMLNVIYTNNFDDIINGVYVEVLRDDIIELCQREVGYDLIPIIAIDWEKAINIDLENKKIPFFIGYTFAAPYELRNGNCYVSSEIKPVKQYYELSKNGASEYGKEFLQLWMQSTYLADNKTHMYKWEEQLKLE